MLWLMPKDCFGMVYLVPVTFSSQLTQGIAVEHRKWLDTDNHSDRWFGNEEPYTAKERRNLIMHWAGKAWKALSSAKYDKQRRKCWTMTRCLMTADESEGSLIKPEGLDNYSVSSPSIIDPTSEQPTGNHTDVKPAELDPDAVDPDIEICPDDPILDPDENEGEKNIFDFIDNVCNI